MSRETRTAAERAQEAYDVARRRAERSRSRLEAAQRAVVDARTEHEANVRRLVYLRQNPDLPEQPSEDTEATGSEEPDA